MKIYEVIFTKTMIMKDIAEKLSEHELNDNYYKFNNYDSNILFYEIEDAKKFYEKLKNNDMKIKQVKGFFNLKYYEIDNIQLNELILDNSINKKEIEENGGITANRIKIYENTLSDINIKHAGFSIKDLKNYIKESK